MSDLVTRLIDGAADLPVLTEVLPSIIGALDPTLPGAQTHHHDLWQMQVAAQQLVILVDGLGLNLLEGRMGHAPTLRAHRNDLNMARTILPSTTAAAITSFGTGALPGKTRMVGYSVAIPASGNSTRQGPPTIYSPATLNGLTTMNLLAFTDGIDVESWQSEPTLFERLASAGVESVVISPPTFASSGLTRAALRGSRHVGAVSLTDRVNAALKELRKGAPLVYLYWSDIDHAGHKHGAHSPQWTAALEEFDAGLKTLLRHLPAGVQTMLTADHGMIDIEQRHLTDVATTPALAADVRITAGETRALHVHAAPGKGDEVRARWAETLGDKAEVISPQQAEELVGEGPGVPAMGDALVLMRDHYGVVDSRTQPAGAIGLIGVHGSFTDDEILIPVLRLT